MLKLKNEKFIYGENARAIKILDEYIKNYVVEDELDIKDLNELIFYKESIIKSQEKLAERMQMLEEDEKNVN